MKKLGVVFGMALLIASCSLLRTAPQIEYRTEPLPLPAEPFLPQVADSELECLPNDVYFRLRRRFLSLERWAYEMRDVIVSTHGDKTEVDWPERGPIATKVR